jgi:propionyl-CoA carboxylase alpha chain
MIKTLLIANRGEIARRIIKTCRRLDITTVAVFSDADADAAHVAEADMAVRLGGAAPDESYLDGGAIIAAALRAGADAIHPGYGFLSERADFAQDTLDAGLCFVGPEPAVISSLGSKIESRRIMAAAGVPLLGSAEVSLEMSPDELAKAGSGVGYPLLVKAWAGGGGRGLRIVTDPEALAELVATASSEAASAFGDGTVYLERYVAPSRHVEVQVFGDHHGRVIHLGERECSIQRRYQKVIEESPSPSIDEETRTALHNAAVKAGEAVGYTNAGTVEFLLAPSGEFFFLEVNTRLQVEHPVTEAVLGLDLVALQLAVASGSALPEQSAVPEPNGHAIEARVYAEDPTRQFAPSTGTIERFVVPDGVRADSAIDGAGVITSHYDAMIAKVIAHGDDREQAINRLAKSLRHTELVGIEHNIALLVATLEHDEFRGGDGDTGFIERHGPAALGAALVDSEELDASLVAAALAEQARRRSNANVLPAVSSGFRNVATEPQRVTYGLGERTFEVGYRLESGHLVVAEVDGRALTDPVLYDTALENTAPERTVADRVDLSVGGLRRSYSVYIGEQHISVSSSCGALSVQRRHRFVEPADEVEAGSLVASMPGTVRDVVVKRGDRVTGGDTLIVLEAMKMEMAVKAGVDGTVESINVDVGDTVEVGDVLVVIDGDQDLSPD